MLARLSAAASQVDFPQMSLRTDERFSLDMETFRLVVPVPDITWGRVAEMCERAMNPMYKGLYSILEKDMEHVAQILASLEVPEPTETTSSDSSAAVCNENSLSELLIIRSPNPSVPTIVVTPCPREPRVECCQVPYQDSAFRNQLTVPTGPIPLNQSFPPMTAPRRASARCINHWIWKNGHWQATLRTLEPRPRALKHRKKSRAGTIKSQG
ncbi:hypothetical protein B0H16DRAFT_1550164 [Mycena metata]|uniref:Uncharacterized protein n=1 Tax=Mycena metata TaxID=1033252 RepID=A0AAD7IVR7_9AGAR|nr:hypothetical protein B0H16DRAFT_1550164 [Mycena metata]